MYASEEKLQPDAYPYASAGAPPPRRLRLAALLLLLPVIGTLMLALDHNHASPTMDRLDVGSVPEIRSHNGVLQTTIEAKPQTIILGNASFAGATYNGVYAGPILRVQPGDRVKIHLVNHMPDPINLHFHGMRVTPLEPGDNVHVRVAPNATYDYDFVVPPGHPPGLFWIHDHAHGLAEAHVMAGLAGTLLVEGFAHSFSGMGDIPQKLVVFKDWGIPGCSGNFLKVEAHCRLISINGQPTWSSQFAAGSAQIWRVANEGANLILHLTMPGVQMRIIGRDGMPALDAPVSDKVDIMPASRMDILVSAAAPGHFTLLANNVPTGAPGHFSTKRALADVMVTGTAKPLAQTAFVMKSPEDLRKLPISARHMIIFGENAAATIFTINGRTYSPEVLPLRAALGNIEEWTIQNETQDFHVFHIHQLGFQVLEINGQKMDFSGYVDQVRIPERGIVKVLIPFTNPIILGHIMFHCHVLKHEDAGMMAEVLVYNPGGPIKLCKPELPD